MLDEEKNSIISEASHSLIVGLLTNPSACDVARGRLGPDDFDFVAEDQMIYRAILDLQDHNKSLDELTIAKYVDSYSEGEFAADKVVSYLKQLRIKYSNVYEIDTFLDIISEFITETRLHQFGEDLINLKLNPQNSNVAIQKITEDFNDIISGRKTENLKSFSEVIEKYINNLDELVNRDQDSFTGTDTGFTDLNHITNGWQPGDMIVLAARPSIGKTALSLNFLYHAAKEAETKKNEAVVMFSLEMGSESIAERMISMISNVPSTQLRSYSLNEQDLFAVRNAAAQIAKLPIFISDASSINISDIQAKLQLLSKTYKIKLVVVDYLQLISTSDNSGSRVNEVGKISRTLKIIARNIKAPIIAVAQLSRKIEERKGEDRRPMLSDLRESGSIEQDADIVTFIEYDRTQEEKQGQKPKDGTEDFAKAYASTVIVDFYISKHRNGSTGMLNFSYKKDIGKFYSYSKKS